MGLPIIHRKRHDRNWHNARPAGVDSAAKRFSVYFRPLFAYVRSCVGEDAAEDIVVRAFCRAFERAGSGDEERFRSVLFRSARLLCRPALNAHSPNNGDPLDRREREVLSLVFDARLSREQITRIFRIRASRVSAALISGLHKLKEQTSAPRAAARHQTA